LKNNYLKKSNNNIVKGLQIFYIGGIIMSRKTSIMSENLKEEIAKELGVYEQVKKDGGWGNVSSQTCGNIVTKAIEIANRKVEK